MNYLFLEHLLEIHALVINETGGSDRLLDLGRLESVIATQTQNVFGEELYVTIHEKAAAIMRGIIADHPFADGNKRTASLAALTFSDINGHTFTAENGEIEDFAVKAATDHLDIPEIALWLKNHTARTSS